MRSGHTVFFKPTTVLRQVKSRRNHGFTLLEMLIAVAIFSGLVILILGVFARSATSSARVALIREKSEASRRLMTQITNDFHYVYAEKDFQDGVDPAPRRAFYFKANGSGLVMLLRYPGATEEQLIRKEYSQTVQGNNARLMLREERDCRLQGANNQLLCSLIGGSEVDLVPEQFALNYNPVLEPVFSGQEINRLDPSAAEGFLKLQMTIKSFDLIPLCDDQLVEAGSCYKVETLLSAGDA